MLPVAYSQAQVRVGVGIGVGPGYIAAGPPVCTYGYYDYAPYACAPYGFYGPQYFVGGFFVGAGPWYHWGHPTGFWGRPGWGRAGWGRPGVGPWLCSPRRSLRTRWRCSRLRREWRISWWPASTAAVSTVGAVSTVADTGNEPLRLKRQRLAARRCQPFSFARSSRGNRNLPRLCRLNAHFLQFF